MTTDQKPSETLESIFTKFLLHRVNAKYPPDFPPPPINKKKTLIFDLDDTLIHSSDTPPNPGIDSFKTGVLGFYVFKRPGLDKFMEKFSKIYDIFIFTSGDRDYADPIINVICPFVDLQHRLYRSSCTIENNQIHKDIDAFKRPKNKIILIEDNPAIKKDHPDNTIIVPKWNLSSKDTILIDWLPKILDNCAKSSDVRDIIRNIKV